MVGTTQSRIEPIATKADHILSSAKAYHVKIIDTAISDVKIIEPNVFGDDRGLSLIHI